MDPLPLRRARRVLVAGLLFWTLVEARLVQTQIVKAPQLSRDVVIESRELLQAQRGSIYDRHGLPLASTVLAPLEDRDLLLRGPYARHYPMGVAAASVTGLVGRTAWGYVGVEGTEQTFDALLRGREGRACYVITGGGRACTFEPLRIDRLPEPGASVRLTIDAVYQAAAHLEADHLRTQFQAKWAGVLVMRPSTGEILAAGSSPCADPDSFVPGLTTVNPLWSKAFEPGSSFKVVVLAAALAHGLTGPEDLIDCEGGVWVAGGKTWRDTSPLGEVPLREAVAKSSNIAMGKLARRLGAERVWEMAYALGFGQALSSHLGGQTSGFLPPPSTLREGPLIAFAIGQGVSVTAVQLLSAYCAVANGGTLMTPLLAQTQEGGGDEVRRAISPEVARTLTSLLCDVVERGTGRAARHELFAVAGKTGTAQVAGQGGVGYLRGEYVATFAGFFPAQRPEVAMLVVVAHPRTGFYGGAVCAPAFGRMVNRLLAAPGGCLYPILASALSSVPRCDEQPPEGAHG